MLVLEAVCHLHWVAVLTGRITCCMFMSCFIQGTWLHGAQGVKQGVGSFFFFLGTAKCVPVLFVYCLPSKPCRQYITIHCFVVF